MLLPRSHRYIIFFATILVLLMAGQAFGITAVDCFSCHKRDQFQKKVKHDPAASGDCLSCHSPHVSRYKGMLQMKVKKLCYTCHPEAEEQQSKGYQHKPVEEGNCLGCHNPHSSDQDFLLKEPEKNLCFTCHSDMPRKFKYTHPPYAQGECLSCHQPHQAEYPYLLPKKTDELCLGCHSKSDLIKKHKNFPEAPAKCITCHNPHGSSRPSLIRDVLHPPYAESCDNCHTQKGVPVTRDTCFECHPEISEQMSSSHNHLVRYKNNGCTACHSPHAGDDRRLLKGKERHVCGQCHEKTFIRHDKAKYKHVFTDACTNCHAPHGSNHPAMLKGPVVKVCSDCHGQHGKFSHPTGPDIYDPRTGQTLTCISCHATKGSNYPYHTRFDSKKDLCVQCHTAY